MGFKRSPLFVGGDKHLDLLKETIKKLIKTKKALALKYAINAQTNNSSLFVVDSIKIESGKTKEAVAVLKN